MGEGGPGRRHQGELTVGERLKGKVALVAGAGCVGPGWGNGRATCVIFAQEGAKVFAVDRDAEAMRETVARVRDGGGEITTHVCDVTDAKAVAAMVETCVTAYGRIDVLVNNVGGSSAGGPVELTLEGWESQIDYNLTSVFLACKYVLPVMVRQNAGAIVNTSSSSGIRFTGSPQVGYAAAKAARHPVLARGRGAIRQARHPGEHGDPGPDAHAHGRGAAGQAARRRRCRGAAKAARQPHSARLHG